MLHLFLKHYVLFLKYAAFVFQTLCCIFQSLFHFFKKCANPYESAHFIYQFRSIVFIPDSVTLPVASSHTGSSRGSISPIKIRAFETAFFYFIVVCDGQWYTETIRKRPCQVCLSVPGV